MSDDSMLVLTETVVPALGAVVATALFLGPLPAVLAARRQGSLGGLSPMLFPFITFNCFAWLAYGIVREDVFIVLSNVSGLYLGIFYLLVGHRLAASARIASTLEATFLGLGVFWGIVCVVARWAPERAEALIGNGAMTMSLCMFAAPLGTMRQVLRERNTVYINLGFLGGQLVSCVLWVVYGFATSDPVMLAPNIVGLLFGLSQLVLVCSLPRNMAVFGLPARAMPTSAADPAAFKFGAEQPEVVVLPTLDGAGVPGMVQPHHFDQQQPPASPRSPRSPLSPRRPPPHRRPSAHAQQIHNEMNAAAPAANMATPLVTPIGILEQQQQQMQMPPHLSLDDDASGQQHHHQHMQQHSEMLPPPEPLHTVHEQQQHMPVAPIVHEHQQEQPRFAELPQAYEPVPFQPETQQRYDLPVAPQEQQHFEQHDHQYEQHQHHDKTAPEPSPTLPSLAGSLPAPPPSQQLQQRLSRGESAHLAQV